MERSWLRGPSRRPGSCLGAMERSIGRASLSVVEYRILRATAVRGGSRPVDGPDSRPTGEPDRLMGVSIDVTEPSAPQKALRASEARLEAGVELAGLAFYEVDFGAGAVHVDDRFRDLCGVPARPGGRGSRHWSSGWSICIPTTAPGCWTSASSCTTESYDGLLEYRYLHPGHGRSGSSTSRGVAARDAAGRAVNSYGVLRDVTERKRAEDELHDLSQRLIGAHEAERALLARELHDDVSQRLAVLAIDVGRAELAAPEAAQAEAMQEVRAGLVRLSEDIHSLAYQLHPSVLEELGLVGGAAHRMRTTRAPGPARPLGGPRATARGHRQGRGALPVPRRAGGAQQRGPPRRGTRRDSHAATDGRRAAPRRVRRRRRL